MAFTRCHGISQVHFIHDGDGGKVWSLVCEQNEKQVVKRFRNFVKRFLSERFVLTFSGKILPSALWGFYWILLDTRGLYKSDIWNLRTGMT